LNVDTNAVLPTAQEKVGDPDNRSVDGGVDVRPRRGADVDRRSAPAARALEQVVAKALVPAADDAAKQPRQQAFIRLTSERLELEGAGTRGVVADRGHALLRDRKLDPERTAEGDHLWAGRPGREERLGQPGPRLRDRARAPHPESGQEQGHEQDDGDEHKARRPSRATGGAQGPLPLARAGGRRHRRDANEAVRCLQHGDGSGLRRHRIRFVPKFARIEGERAVLEEGPLPSRRPERNDLGGTMATMPGGAPRIEIPRWIQLVGLPLLLVLAWVVASAVGHVVFIFLVAALVAFLLDPVVRAFERVRIPRGFAVAIVYLTFAMLLLVAILAVATVVVDETRSAADRIEAYVTEEEGQPPQTAAERDVDRLQRWLDDQGVGVDIRQEGQEVVDSADRNIEDYTRTLIDFLEGAAIGIFEFLFALVLIIVVSIYMLLDMSRLSRAADRRFPPPPGSRPLVRTIEGALAGYVKGQVLLSLIIGTSAGIGLWLLGTLGWVQDADKYALLFASWVAATEVIPYLGPWLGAMPPFFYALVTEPISALWVAILFLAIHQIEGHIVVPNVMGSALRLHPLLVIFGLLAGAQIYGLAGALIALPLLAAGRAVWEFFSRQIALESWAEGGVVPVEVEIEPTSPPPTRAADASAAQGSSHPLAQVPPEEPPAAAER
jgi:predicted PurR-regulated permease PerM